MASINLKSVKITFGLIFGTMTECKRCKAVFKTGKHEIYLVPDIEGYEVMADCPYCGQRHRLGKQKVS